MVRCCCAMLAQMNQKMVNMNTTMSLTAIDKRLMMKQAIALALLTLSQCMVCLDSDVVMWWCDFGDFHQSQFKTRFWWCSDQTQRNPINWDQAWSIGIRPDQSGLGPIKPDWAQSGAQFWQCSQFLWWPLEIQELTFPQKCWKCQFPILCGVSLVLCNSAASQVVCVT
jgi:hypothetical protein